MTDHPKTREDKDHSRDTQSKTLLTDLYQLTMNAAYFDAGKDDVATFDLFIRKLPEDWGYFVANGIEDAIEYATNIHFSDDDIDYLRSSGIFKEDYLRFLKDLRFTGDIYAVKEGTPIAPNTPILRVTAPRTEAQLLETTLLNIINFQTMVATKASRVVQAASPGCIVDFGLRRAQGMDAALKGARAAYIAGAIGTSNVLAGKEYGIPIKGTHAHSFIMSFDSELEAFRAYVRTFPDAATLLIDTYDTLEGARNACIVGRELEERGKRLGAVRLDSGDLCDLSIRVREILDLAGLSYVKILASNDLNEYKIADLRAMGARIDSWGVGTEMITAKPTAAIPGVYKLVEDTAGAKIKLAPGKKTFPGLKQVYRISKDGQYQSDILALDGETISLEEGLTATPLLEKVISQGVRISSRRSLAQIRSYSLDCVARLPQSARELSCTAPFGYSVSKGLRSLVDELSERYMVRGEAA